MGFLKKLLGSMPGADDHGVDSAAAESHDHESDRDTAEPAATHESPAEDKA